MSIVGRVLVLVFVMLASLAAGSYVGSSRGWFQPEVTVFVENASGEELRSLVIEHKGFGVSGTLELAPPKPGESVRASFFHRGEGSCQVSVVLANGSVLSGQCGYVEPGYSFAFKVSPGGLVGGLGP